jgi:two-component system, LytTR family, sensor kinase
MPRLLSSKLGKAVRKRSSFWLHRDKRMLPGDEFALSHVLRDTFIPMRTTWDKLAAPHIWREFAVSFAAWSLASVAPIFQTLSMPEAQSGQYGPIPRLVLQMLLRYWTYALISVPLFRLSSEFLFGRGRIWRPLLVHVLAFPGFIACYVLLRLFVLRIVMPPINEAVPSFTTLLHTSLQLLFAEQLWSFVGVASLAHVVQYYRDARDRELRESELRTALAEQQLQSLKLQLHPHFLFNTLNGISALMSTDVRTARSMMAQLCELLRMALQHTERQEILLRQELEFIQGYLDLQKMRLGERLSATVDIRTEFLDARVPSMLLQPVVENAIRHGIEKRRDGGTLIISAGRNGPRLRLEVRNDGPVLLPRRPDECGIGVANTRRRLETLYGDNFVFTMFGLPEGGVSVVIEIPYVEAAELCQNSPVS